MPILLINLSLIFYQKKSDHKNNPKKQLHRSFLDELPHETAGWYLKFIFFCFFKILNE